MSNQQTRDDGIAYTDIRLPLLYFPPIQWFLATNNAQRVFLGSAIPYRKQTYRNRCEIMTANGVMKLSVPVLKMGLNTSFEEVLADYKLPWHRQHWRAISSAYSRSPFFMYYEDEIRLFFEGMSGIALADHNENIIRTLLRLLQLNVEIVHPDNEESANPLIKDLSPYFLKKSSEKKKPEIPLSPYRQVFSEKFPFCPKLSILDLLFNLGPESASYLGKNAMLLSGASY